MEQSQAQNPVPDAEQQDGTQPETTSASTTTESEESSATPANTLNPDLMKKVWESILTGTDLPEEATETAQQMFRNGMEQLRQQISIIETLGLRLFGNSEFVEVMPGQSSSPTTTEDDPSPSTSEDETSTSDG